jgi:hypothetical protein
MKNEDGLTPLRRVGLESVAQYLRCDAGRLAIALRRLAEDPSAIQYGIGESASITPSVTLYSLPPAPAKGKVLVMIRSKSNRRSPPPISPRPCL